MTMKSPDELNARKEDAEPLNRKFHELTDEELAQVNGGDYWDNSAFITESEKNVSVQF